MAMSRRFTTLCFMKYHQRYKWVVEGQRQHLKPGTIPWCTADILGVQGPVFCFCTLVQYSMCFYFISASFRKHCIIISSWSQRRDYFKWLWVIVLEGPAGRALGTGESNITVRLLTVCWTKPLQSKKIKNVLQNKPQTAGLLLLVWRLNIALYPGQSLS